MHSRPRSAVAGAHAQLSLIAWALLGAGGLLLVGGCDASTALPPVTDIAVQGDLGAYDGGVRCVPRTETCNGLDDDCDGEADEVAGVEAQVFDDPQNCGACGRVCAGPRATFACRVGRCVVTSCEPGFGDYNGDPDDGCETDCVITAGGREICDGQDNDCDGPVDEGFALDDDPLNCGACGRACPAPPNGSPACIDGECGVAECAPGFVDLDGDGESGCEYACTPRGTADTREACNGLDDDCDGRIDEVADLSSPPDTCGASGVCARDCADDAGCADGERCRDGLCGPAEVETIECASDLACQRIHPALACLADMQLVDGAPVLARRCQPRGHGPACDGPAGYRCVRPPGFQLGDEFGACDQQDNDCDGRIDEDYAATLLLPDRVTPRPCVEGVGICARDGLVVCAEDGRGTRCSAEAVAPQTMIDDDCDGIDDDCDERIDEDADDGWVAGPGFEIFAYEASRPGATADAAGRLVEPDEPAAGFVEARACSRPDVQPWTDVTWDEAAEACAAAGGRLCTAAEWGQACGGAAGQAYPYGPAFRPDRCNDGGYDTDPDMPGDQDEALATGSRPNCARDGVYDLSGNVKEWTDAAAAGLRVVRGGGFETNLAEALRCDRSDDLKDRALRHPAIGFRCCR